MRLLPCLGSRLFMIPVQPEKKRAVSDRFATALVLDTFVCFRMKIFSFEKNDVVVLCFIFRCKKCDKINKRDFLEIYENKVKELDSITLGIAYKVC